MHQENGWDLPDLEFLGGISVGLAVSAEHLVVVGQLLFLREEPQTILPKSNKHFKLNYFNNFSLPSTINLNAVTARTLCASVKDIHMTDLQGALAGGGQRQ